MSIIKKTDLSIMSIESQEEQAARFELYRQIKEGIADIASGNTRPFSEVLTDLRRNRK